MATPLDFDHASRRETNDNPDFMASAPSQGMNRHMLMQMILRMLGRAYGPMKKAPDANSLREYRGFRGREGNLHG